MRTLTSAQTPERGLLGGKGASLVDLIALGAPVPPAFAITTEACRAYFEGGELPPELAREMPTALAYLESQLGRRFGDPGRPLLVSVRSGAPTSMPGMMDTILNVGLSGRTLAGFIDSTGGEQSFGQDCLDRLAKMFSATVGMPLPEDPAEQLTRSVEAVFRSWNSKRAQLYRRFNKIPNTGTAVVVQAMVFGNSDERSGSGVAFTRDPSTGHRLLYGDFIARAQGEDVVSGSHNTEDLQHMRSRLPECHAQLEAIARRVEERFGDMCELEFTVERGRLWLLQARAGQRSAEAAIVSAVQLAEEGVIDRDTALRRVDRRALERVLRPSLDEPRLAPGSVLTTAVGASPGVATGALVFDSASAVARSRRGEQTVLVRAETCPEDLEGIIACTGLLTLRGGKTSHAAVVTRGLGRPCVCGAEELAIDAERGELSCGGTVVREGEPISLDGSGGRVILGAAPLAEPSPPQEAITLKEWIEAGGAGR